MPAKNPPPHGRTFFDSALWTDQGQTAKDDPDIASQLVLNAGVI